MTNRLLIGASLMAALALATTGVAQDRAQTQEHAQTGTGQKARPDKATQKFLTEAIEGNLAEVQMGQLAERDGNSDGVRSFGQMLDKDHTDLNQKATEVANSFGMTPPTGPNTKQKVAYDRMATQSGANFDRQFARDMVAGHKEAIREYEREAKRNDAAGAYAKEALPTLRKHLETAQSLIAPATTGKR
jgi:putative membrane protein